MNTIKMTLFILVSDYGILAAGLLVISGVLILSRFWLLGPKLELYLIKRSG